VLNIAFVAVPKITDPELAVTGVTPVGVNVSVYAVPAVPETPKLLNVAIPDEAVAVVVPTNVAPLLTVAVTTTPDDMTVLPPLSVIRTTG